MSEPLRSIPPLIPLPPPHHPTSIPHNPAHPSSSTREDDIDRYATLFSPATPRASPNLPPLFPDPARTDPQPPAPTSSSAQRPHHRPKTPSSASSDFGSFVSVPSKQDPLSIEEFSLDSCYFPSFSPITETTFDPPTHHEASSPSKAADPISHAQTTSLNFFDKFAEDAKKASEMNKRGVLDELLEHEDDPLYWLNPSSSSSSTANGNASTKHHALDTANGDLLDLDQGDLHMAIEQRQSRHPERPTTTTSPSPLSVSPHPFDPPPRSPSVPLPSPSRLSPPLSASPPRPSQIHRSHSSSPSSPPPDTQNPNLALSSSYTSLGTLSSRFMSSLLSSSRPAPASTSPESHRTLDTLFTPPSSKASGPLRTHSPSTSTSTSLPHARPQHTQSLSSYLPSASTSASSSSARATTISHGTPFASHIYTPPTGAPGFLGDPKWDKGFSADFDREQVERRSVRLAGRKESTTAVLSIALADLIRPHLPALSRLPRTWTLLYSLDQHGISLNTLYARCEAHVGMLVVVRDSGDAVFGAWMGEGVRLERSGYYGSGESFLWRCVREKLQVFKWTGKNDYVALCEPGYISFGGGEGHYGLYLDDTLYDGSSAPCPTFDNEPLCSGAAGKGGTATFECVGLEVWGVGP